MFICSLGESWTAFQRTTLLKTRNASLEQHWKCTNTEKRQCVRNLLAVCASLTGHSSSTLHSHTWCCFTASLLGLAGIPPSCKYRELLEEDCQTPESGASPALQEEKACRLLSNQSALHFYSPLSMQRALANWNNGQSCSCRISALCLFLGASNHTASL